MVNTDGYKIQEAKIQLANTKKYIDINDVARLSGYSISSIRRFLGLGKLKGFQQKKSIDKTRGSKILFSRDYIESWIQRGSDGTR